jgi:dolichyl-phosphate beta-glucosyltransferase
VSEAPELSVVIPAYNEEARLGTTLERVAGWIDARRLEAEIVVVDDGSKDATPRIAARALEGRRGTVLGGRPNRGKGYAVRRGALSAKGRWVLVSDADLSTPIEEYDVLASAARTRRLDVAIGSRAVDPTRVEVRQNPVRQLMGKTFNRAMRVMTGLPFQDTQCGFKLMRRERTRPLFERMVVDRFAFDVELLFLAVRAGLAVGEVPVVWRNAPGSKVSLVGDPANMLWDVARVRWRSYRGLYGPPGQ